MAVFLGVVGTFAGLMSLLIAFFSVAGKGTDIQLILAGVLLISAVTCFSGQAIIDRMDKANKLAEGKQALSAACKETGKDTGAVAG